MDAKWMLADEDSQRWQGSNLGWTLQHSWQRLEVEIYSYTYIYTYTYTYTHRFYG